ncbi:LysR family transcriptional regulator [Hydrogenophaga sp. PBL-H3]|uniref:LysR family transcriptional regulator n=1 Tax=Hydrogenophaga sp. PBL-H3 TaxID=434010 RepID=UPI00131F91B9|nr:LysR family transcriptional regulator [Hydrogenophaga sp. PBL-H3]QHE78038.1 LysR family transcriptional regulator [Hydrogenophaga sp. PBL-H3]QHE82463.1 LysR family transcriptional regulator [Hydrogenophaga sp. PBL-H3]
MKFDFESLKVFLAVLDHGSFSAAARSLGKVPSAVSMTIAHLEADLNLVLFDRSGREPRPTPQAVSLVPQARLLAEQLLKLDTHALALTQGLEPCLTIAVAPELLAATPWSAALVQLSAEHPLLEVEVLAAPQTDALGMLHSGRAHVALVFERASLDAREGFQEVGREILVAVVAPTHPLLSGRKATRGLREDDLAVERQIIVAGRHSGDVDERIVMSRHQWRTDTPVAAMGLVIAGLGWAWLPQGFVRAPLAAGQLVQIPLENFSNAMPLWVDAVWPKARPLGVAARRFLTLLDGVRRQNEPQGKAAVIKRRPAARG